MSFTGTNYTGNPTATETPSAAPGPGVAPIIILPTDADDFSSAAFYQALKTSADFIAWLTSNMGGGVFGDGSDGALVYDGSTTILGMAPSSSIYTLTRDIFASSLTVNNGVTIATNGFRVYVRGILTTIGTGIITADGTNGVTTTPGAASPTGTVLGGALGGAGGSSGAGSAGVNVVNSLGAAGGAGGISGGGNAGGAGGTSTAPATALGSPRAFDAALMGRIVGISAGASATTAFTGGGGGGGGGNFSAGSGTPGAGGGGGGVLCVSARQLALAAAGSLRARGGVGGAAVTGGQNGGGGGGGGGVLVIAYGSKNAITFSAATNCPGGTGGVGVGAGSATGATGSNGSLFEIALA